MNLMQLKLAVAIVVLGSSVYKVQAIVDATEVTQPANFGPGEAHHVRGVLDGGLISMPHLHASLIMASGVLDL